MAFFSYFLSVVSYVWVIPNLFFLQEADCTACELSSEIWELKAEIARNAAAAAKAAREKKARETKALAAWQKGEAERIKKLAEDLKVQKIDNVLNLVKQIKGKLWYDRRRI